MKRRTKKTIFDTDLSMAEMNELLKEISENVRQNIFDQGLPLIYSKDGWIVKEFSDGRIERIQRSNSNWIKLDENKRKIRLINN